MFKSSEDYILRQVELSDQDIPTTRLILDLADILTGPTSGGNARYLAECAGRHPEELATAMKEAAERYFKLVAEEKKQEEVVAGEVK